MLSPILLNFTSRFGSKSTKPFASTTFPSCPEHLALVGVQVQLSHFFSQEKASWLETWRLVWPSVATPSIWTGTSLLTWWHASSEGSARVTSGVWWRTSTCSPGLSCRSSRATSRRSRRPKQSTFGSSHWTCKRPACFLELLSFAQKTLFRFHSWSRPHTIIFSHYYILTQLYSHRAQFVSKRFLSRCEPSSEKPRSSFPTWKLCSVGFSGGRSFSQQTHFHFHRVKSLKKPVTMSRNLVRSVTNIYKLLTNPAHSKANIYRWDI